MILEIHNKEDYTENKNIKNLHLVNIKLNSIN